MKSNSYLALFFFCFFSSLVHAQVPQLAWAHGAGSTAFDAGNAIAIDAQGNTYTTGFYAGTVDFDPSSGVYNLTATGNSSMFILKLNAAGNLVWAKSIGGDGRVEGNGIAVAPSGNIYITGMFSGTVDFDLGPGFDTITNADNPCNTEIFILKLNNSGNFVWGKSVAGVAPICTSETDDGFSLDLDQSENVYVSGIFSGHADFNPSTAPADTVILRTAGYSYENDLFILKLDAAGNYKWVKQVESSTGYNIHVTPTGFVYVTGLYSYSTDFDPGPGADSLPYFGNWDAYILKLDTAGNHIWAKGFGGSGDDRGLAVTTDAAGNLYSTGHFSGTIDFDPSSATYMLANPAYARGAYVMKMDPAGNFIWVKGFVGTIAGGGEREGRALAVDAANNIYTIGHFTETVDFNPSTAPADTFNLTAANGPFNTDVFIVKTDSAGNFIWAISLGNTGDDRGRGIVLDANNAIFSTGYYAGSVDFDPQGGTQIITAAGGGDVYVQKLAQTITAVADENFSSCKISVFPNPFGETTSLFVQSSTTGNFSFELFDVNGKMVRSQTGAFNQQMPLEKNNLSAGVYLYRITQNGELVGTGKLVVQ